MFLQDHTVDINVSRLIHACTIPANQLIDVPPAATLITEEVSMCLFSGIQRNPEIAHRHKSREIRRVDGGNFIQAGLRSRTDQGGR